MRKWQARGFSAWCVGLALAVSAAGGAAAEGGAIYSWRTEDGAYAFTDDEDAIPARYRSQVQVRAMKRLVDYERFTPADDDATDVYETQLAQRLVYLRNLNDSLARAAAAEAASLAQAPAPTATGSGELITVRTGGVGLSFPSEAGAGPIVSESVLFRPDGKMIVQNARVTRRDGRVVAIEKPRSREWNLNDALDEGELAEALER
jgi:hypothetical protein